MRRCATPGELARWERELSPHMARERVVAVVAMLAEVVDDECRGCGEPVRRCDPRMRRGERMAHLHCHGEAR
jgi:hypothetical protein